jgi:uncharacterized protein
VKVLEVEIERKRIALSLRLDDEPGAKGAPRSAQAPRERPRAPMTSSAPLKSQEQGGGGALAEALRRASEKSQNAKPKG